MRTAEAFYNIFMYLYNKNILEYGQIARNGTESMIPDTEVRSSKGLFINYVSKILPIFDPPSPLRKQVYYISLCR